MHLTKLFVVFEQFSLGAGNDDLKSKSKKVKVRANFLANQPTEPTSKSRRTIRVIAGSVTGSADNQKWSNNEQELLRGNY